MHLPHFFPVFLNSFARFATSFSYYGLVMDLQNFGFSIYLIQVAFGSIDIPAKLIAAIGMNYIGRRTTQALSVILAGLAILANIFVPYGEILRTLGLDCIERRVMCCFVNAQSDSLF